ncbi:hypothetical protein SSS_00331 [Sarcoptes scabiei]|uniref:Uncharacterized protein n=1 Tax=Sarcoptes scabiei TaxID=52283 RepID=A0A834REB1_SARSC|nr:hypothetical protein SSS_00331 [Sarcoptes scabiei]
MMDEKPERTGTLRKKTNQDQRSSELTYQSKVPLRCKRRNETFQSVENSAEDVLDQYLIDQSGLLQLSTQQKLELGYKIDQFSDNRHLPKYIPIFKTLFVCLDQKIEEMTKEPILEDKLDKVSNKIDNIGQEIGKIPKTAKPPTRNPRALFRHLRMRMQLLITVPYSTKTRKHENNYRETQSSKHIS